MHTPGPNSERLWEAAKRVIPGGVYSPVRAFGAVGGVPVFAESGAGCRVRDADGRDYVDCVMSWGALILGHAHPKVVEAVKAAAGKGMTFGMPTGAENRLAELVVRMFPGTEKVRMVSSGTEAAMSAIRLARGFTGRDLVVKFDGCYHGHSDGLLVSAGSGPATFGIPGTKGVPASYAEKTLVAPYNDAARLDEVFGRFGRDIACVIVEPVAGNMGVVPPTPGWLKSMKELTARHGALLVFDEVITGFRVGLSGAQGLYGVTPDLTVLGKILGGGMPAAAFGGRKEVMDALAPSGPVYQAGTLSGNPVAMAAGLATLEVLRDENPYPRLEKLSGMLAEGLAEAARKAGVPVAQNRVGSMQTLFFTDAPVFDYAGARRSDAARYARFFHGMLERGVILAPSQFEACFVSTAHGEADVAKVVEAAGEAMRAL